MAKRIHIHGVRRKEVDASLLGYVYFLEGKRLRQQRRERDALEKAKRRAHGQKRGERHE